MKKTLPLSLLLAATMYSATADAQVKFGVKGGLNVSKMSFTEDVFDGSNQAGWFAGPTVKFTLPVVGLSFDVAGLYNQTTSKVENTGNPSGEESIKRQSIEVPIHLRYGVGLSSLANVFVFAGPQFGFNVGDDEFEWKAPNDYKNTFQLKKSTLSVNLGFGVTVFGHLQATANYNIACGKTAEANVWDTAGNVIKDSDEGRNNSWQIGLAYFF